MLARRLHEATRRFFGSRDQEFDVIRRVAALFVLCAAVATPAMAGFIEPVPEPMTGWLIGSGLVGLGIRAYRKRRR
jgi:hypothetical protein